ncbi:hypothetical protein [Sicyoidochytrium minutum DNA virus]|nr:hypothetical protein [Sicyoidochytrium minutum DNA virus]
MKVSKRETKKVAPVRRQRSSVAPTWIIIGVSLVVVIAIFVAIMLIYAPY